MTLTSVRVEVRDNRNPKIVVLGVGGGGGNAVKNMTRKELKGVEFVIANTDAQVLMDCTGDIEPIQLGENTTQGLGAGANPEIGKSAAEESKEEIKEILKGVHLCFITAGMGGGTGTGASPVIAKIARDLNVLTVGVVTKPFFFEGSRRMEIAERGIKELEDIVNTLLVIPNQNLFSISNDSTTTLKAFELADDVLYHGVKSITDLMVRPGLINLDFADVDSVLKYPGRAMMGVGSSDPKIENESRGRIAALNAMNNQLLEETNLQDAKAVLINIIGGEDQTLFDLSAASEEIRKSVNDNVHVIVGTTHDPEYNGKLSVSLVATGLTSSENYSADTFHRQEVIPEHNWDNEPTMHDSIEDISNGEWLEEEIDEATEQLVVKEELHQESNLATGEPSVEGNVKVNNVPDRPLQSFTAPKRMNHEFLNETDQQDLDNNNHDELYHEYQDVSRFMPNEEDDTEADTLEELAEPHPQEKKNNSFNFGFLGRREKKVDKLKVPAFIRRQAN